MTFTAGCNRWGEVQTRKDEHDVHLDEPLEGERFSSTS